MISDEDIEKEIITKAGFPLYTDYWDKYFSKMNGDQVKETLSIIFTFNETCEIIKSDDLAIEMVVATMIDNIKRDAAKRIKQSKASRSNGKLGGRPKMTDKPKKTTKKIDSKKIYGEFKKVRLTDDEYDKLVENNGIKTNGYIKKLDEYIENTGKVYKNHYLTICNWVKKDAKSNNNDREQIIDNMREFTKEVEW